MCTVTPLLRITLQKNTCLTLAGILDIICFCVWLLAVTVMHAMNWYLPHIQVSKWGSNWKINPTNDFCCTQYGCDQMNGLYRRSRRFLWFLVKKSPAAAAVRYREVEKDVFRNDLCHPYSCCVVLNYLDAVFPEYRLDFPRHRFHPDFSTNAGERFLYSLSFW